MDRRSFVKLTLSILCLSGLCFQVTHLSIQYFRYATTTATRMDVNNTIEPPITAICFPLIDVIDYAFLYESTGVNQNEELSRTEIGDFLSTHPMHTYFNHTPLGNEFIVSCRYRDKYAQMRKGDRNHCQSIFRVERYFTTRYMCYRVTARTGHIFDKDLIGASETYIHSLQIIGISDRFSKARVINPILYYGDHDNYPYLSRLYSTEIRNVLRNYTSSIADNYISVTNSVVQKDKLPPPFDTNCVWIPAPLRHEIRKQCYIKGFARFGSVPGSMIYPEPGLNQTIYQFDLKNFNATERVRKDCDARSNINSCKSRHSVTSPTASRGYNVSRVYISVNSPQYPARSEVSVPTMSFIDFFSMASSCFGTWLGISFMSVTVLFDRMTGRKTDRKKSKTRSIVILQNNRTTVDYVHHIVHHRNTRSQHGQVQGTS